MFLATAGTSDSLDILNNFDKMKNGGARRPLSVINRAIQAESLEDPDCRRSTETARSQRTQRRP